MDCRIVLLLAIAVTSCACFPEPAMPAGPWTLQPKCPCGRMYFPVCGWDGQTLKTYSNMCEFECTANFYKYYFGKEMFVKKHEECNENGATGIELN